MEDDLISDRKYNTLLHWLKRGEGLLRARKPLNIEEADEDLKPREMVGPLQLDLQKAIVNAIEQAGEDIGVAARQCIAEKTREKWGGATRFELKDELKALQKERRYNQERAKRLKETGVGDNVEEARAQFRLEAKIAKWKAEAIGELLSDVRDEGPQSDDSQGGAPRLTEDEVRETIGLVVEKLDEQPNASLTTDISEQFSQTGRDVENHLRIARERFDLDIPGTNQTSEWRDVLPDLKRRF